MVPTDSPNSPDITDIDIMREKNIYIAWCGDYVKSLRFFPCRVVVSPSFFEIGGSVVLRYNVLEVLSNYNIAADFFED